jgi:hypothetical protein
MKKATYISAYAATLLIAASAQAALNFEISGSQIELTTGDTSIETSNGSGSNSFEASYATDSEVGSYAVFDISTTNSDTDETTAYGQLKVTYLSDDGGVEGNIMIAQTTSSQGLTDSGTLSVFFNTTTSGGTVTLQFDWYSLGSFVDGVEQEDSSLLSQQINYTALDIDYGQVVSVSTADIDSYALEGDEEIGTIVTASSDEVNGVTSFSSDSNSSSNAYESKSAVSFLSNTDGSQQITMGKTSGSGASLFLFEFRDPSEIANFVDATETVVPEPSSAALLLGCSAVAFAALKRRKRN